jgi:pSer/pThr/pTyr-binding forkhead associated (FHA) protein
MSADDHTSVNEDATSSEENKAFKARLFIERRMGRPVEGEMINLLFGAQMLVGRDRSCEISLSDDSISRKHALVRIDPDAVRLNDLGSTNGTKRNRYRVTEEIIIESGDTISFAKAKAYETRIVIKNEMVSSVRLARGKEAYLLVPQEFLIGFADPENDDVDLKIYDPAILPRHARIEYFAGRVFVVSLDPERPVVVNSNPVREIEIRNHYLIEMGDTLLRFEKQE